MDTISDADQLFGQAIRARRNQLGITLEQLAQVSSVSTGALSKIERGLLSPSLRNAVAIAHALGCEINDLLPTQTTAIHRQQDHLLVTDATNGIVHQLNGVDAARRIAGVAGLPLDTDGVGHMAFVRAYRLQRGWFADDGAIRA